MPCACTPACTEPAVCSELRVAAELFCQDQQQVFCWSTTQLSPPADHQSGDDDTVLSLVDLSNELIGMILLYAGLRATGAAACVSKALHQYVIGDDDLWHQHLCRLCHI